MLTATALLLALVFIVARGTSIQLHHQLLRAYINDRHNYTKTGKRGREVVVLERAAHIARTVTLGAFVLCALTVLVIVARFAP